MIGTSTSHLQLRTSWPVFCRDLCYDNQATHMRAEERFHGYRTLNALKPSRENWGQRIIPLRPGQPHPCQRTENHPIADQTIQRPRRKKHLRRPARYFVHPLSSNVLSHSLESSGIVKNSCLARAERRSTTFTEAERDYVSRRLESRG